MFGIENVCHCLYFNEWKMCVVYFRKIVVIDYPLINTMSRHKRVLLMDCLIWFILINGFGMILEFRQHCSLFVGHGKVFSFQTVSSRCWLIYATSCICHCHYHMQSLQSLKAWIWGIVDNQRRKTIHILYVVCTVRSWSNEC